MASEMMGAMLAVLAAPEGSTFADLVEASGLDPKTDFRFTDLADCDFADADLSGWDLTGADLSRSDLSRVRNAREATIDRCKVEGAQLPPDWPGMEH